MPTDAEISRALNALSTTLRDQRPDTFDASRAEEIVTGAVAGEPTLRARATGPTRGELRVREDGRLLATIDIHEGQWRVERKLGAGGSSWALSQPAHDERQQRS